MFDMPQKPATVKADLFTLVVVQWCLLIKLLIDNENCTMSLCAYVEGFANSVTYVEHYNLSISHLQMKKSVKHEKVVNEYVDTE